MLEDSLLKEKNVSSNKIYSRGVIFENGNEVGIYPMLNKNDISLFYTSLSRGENFWGLTGLRRVKLEGEDIVAGGVLFVYTIFHGNSILRTSHKKLLIPQSRILTREDMEKSDIIISSSNISSRKRLEDFPKSVNKFYQTRNDFYEFKSQDFLILKDSQFE